MRPLTTLLWLACSVFFAASSTSALAFDYSLGFSRTQIPLASGGHAVLDFTLGNPTAAASPTLVLRISSWSGYDLEMVPSPGCGELQISSSFGLLRAETLVPPIPAGSQRQCTLRASRHADTRDNLHVLVFLSNMTPSTAGSAWGVLEFGAFADVGYVAQVESHAVDSQGVAHTVYRIGAENRSAVNLDPIEVVLGQTCTIEPVQIDVDLPGGCVLEESPCWFTGGPGKATHLPAVAAGQTSSCLVRFSDDASLNSSIQTSLSSSFRETSTGNEVSDSSPADNGLDLALNPDANDGNGNGSSPAQLPSTSAWGLALLAFALALFGFAAARRRVD